MRRERLLIAPPFLTGDDLPVLRSAPVDVTDALTLDCVPRLTLLQTLIFLHLALQSLRQRCRANHYRARFNFGEMHRFGFDNLKNAALRDAEHIGGLLCRQHRFAAFRAGYLSARRGLAYGVSAVGRNQHFKFSFDFHLFLDKIRQAI